jgi:putative DNA primase/helicase
MGRADDPVLASVDRIIGGRPSEFEATDDGNALRLVDRHGDGIMFCPERGRWLRWVGAWWHWDVEGVLREHVRELARELPEDSKDEQRHRRLSLSAAGVSATLRMAQTDRDVVVNLAQLDADPHLLNTPAGVVDLRSGTVRVQRPEDLVTKRTNIGISEQPTPRWSRFLAETFDDDELAGYVQRLLGHSLVGAVTEHVLPFAHGAGANGKSVLMDVTQRVLGLGEDGYSISAPADFLMAKASTVHPTEIARLRGARLVVCQEINPGQSFDEAKVKALTGGDALAGRFMRQDYFSFAPTHHLWLVGNHLPEVREGGPAFWRRVRLIEFRHVVPEDRRDPHLAERLVDEEGGGILRWLVDGAAASIDKGIAPPDSVLAATAAYRVDEDIVAAYVTDRCVLGPPRQQGYTVKVPALRQDFETWCRRNGYEPVSSKALTQRLQHRGVETDRSRSVRIYRGIRMLADDAEDEPP